jgi:hypothetical protein
MSWLEFPPAIKFPFAETSAGASIAWPSFADATSSATAHAGQSRMAGEHSRPHSGQIQYSIYINSRPKAFGYLSGTHPTFSEHEPYVAN